MWLQNFTSMRIEPPQYSFCIFLALTAFFLLDSVAVVMTIFELHNLPLFFYSLLKF